MHAANPNVTSLVMTHELLRHVGVDASQVLLVLAHVEACEPGEGQGEGQCRRRQRQDLLRDIELADGEVQLCEVHLHVVLLHVAGDAVRRSVLAAHMPCGVHLHVLVAGATLGALDVPIDEATVPVSILL